MALSILQAKKVQVTWCFLRFNASPKKSDATDEEQSSDDEPPEEVSAAAATALAGSRRNAELAARKAAPKKKRPRTSTKATKAWRADALARGTDGRCFVRSSSARRSFSAVRPERERDSANEAERVGTNASPPAVAAVAEQTWYLGAYSLLLSRNFVFAVYQPKTCLRRSLQHVHKNAFSC